MMRPLIATSDIMKVEVRVEGNVKEKNNQTGQKGEKVMKKMYIVERDIPFSGFTRRTISEINENGNIIIIGVWPNVTSYDLGCFMNDDLWLDYYENKGMSSFLLKGVLNVECNLCPNFYQDNRYNLLQNKEEVEVECYLGDSKKGELLCGRVFTLRGKQLEQFKKGLEMNAKQDAVTYAKWMVEDLWANSFKENREQSIDLGMCPVADDIDILIV